MKTLTSIIAKTALATTFLIGIASNSNEAYAVDTREGIELKVEVEPIIWAAPPEQENPYYDHSLILNDADDSGVLFDMFISGTDFYDNSYPSIQPPTPEKKTNYIPYLAIGGALGIALLVGRSYMNTRKPKNKRFIVPKSDNPYRPPENY